MKVIQYCVFENGSDVKERSKRSGLKEDKETTNTTQIWIGYWAGKDALKDSVGTVREIWI